jgi:hypothetical protein
MTEKLEELPSTASGLWKVRNYTRYRTEDLLDLMKHAEEGMLQYAARQGILNPQLTRDRNYNSTDNTITFDNYAKTKNPTGYRAKRRSEHFVKQAWRNQEIRMLCPDDMDMTPLELLALPSDECGTVLPQDKTLQVLSFILTFYQVPSTANNGGYYQGNVAEKVLDIIKNKAPKLRFVNRVAARKPVKESGDKRLKRLSHDRAQAAYWEAAVILRMFDPLKERVGAANAYATKRKLPPYIAEEEVESLKRKVQDFVFRCERTVNDLKEEGQ